MRSFVDELSKQLYGALDFKQYETAAQVLEQLQELEIIGNVFVTRLIFEAVQTAGRHLLRLERAVTEAAAFGDFPTAEEYIRELQTLENAFGDVDGINITAMIQRSTTFLQLRRGEEERMSVMEEKMKTMEDARQAIELKLSLVTDQRDLQQKEIERLEQERRDVEVKASADRIRLEQVSKLPPLICITKRIYNQNSRPMPNKWTDWKRRRRVGPNRSGRYCRSRSISCSRNWKARSSRPRSKQKRKN